MKKKLLSMIAVMLIMSLTACTYEYEIVSEDTDTIALETDYKTGQVSVTDRIPVRGESFYLVCTYDTGNNPLSEWRATSDKCISMTVNTEGLPEGYSAYIEHMHADIVLKSTSAQIDGIVQDSMDDSDHRVPTKGFPVSDSICYQCDFSISGYTDQFYELWGYAFGDYGYVNSSYKRLTESNIRKAGTYAEKLIVIYDIVIYTPECEDGYVCSVKSEILIPLTGEIETVTRDVITGEIVEDTEEQTGTEQ